MKKLLLAVTAVVLATAGPQLAAADGTTASQQQRPWKHVHGHVQSVDGTKMTFHADDGRILDVDMSDVTPSVRRVLTPNERVTLVGFPGARSNVFHARFIQQDNAGRARARVDETTSQRIHGIVQSIRGNTLTLKADDGRILTVNTADVSPSVRRALRVGQGVEVVGRLRGDPNHVTARFIQRDSSNVARGDHVTRRSAPQASASPRLDVNGDRIHGTVQTLQGPTLTLRADDGRLLTVNVADVPAGELRGLAQGQPITVIGQLKGDRRHVVARFIEPDGSATVARSQLNAP
jgi:hypothetical protein